MEIKKIKIIKKAKTNQKILYLAILGIIIGIIIKGILGNIILGIGIFCLIIYILNLVILRKEMSRIENESK